MTQLNLSNLVYSSKFAGLGNYTNITGSFNVPGMVLNGTTFPSPVYSTVYTQAIDRSYAVSQVLIQFSGLDGLYYVIKGGKENFYTGATRVYSLLTAKFSVSVNSYFANGIYTINLFILTLDPFDAAIVVPAFTVNLSLRLFLPPFVAS